VRAHPELNDCETEVKFLLESITGSYRQPDLKVGIMIDEPSDRVNVRWQDQSLLVKDSFKIGELIKPVDILMDIGPSCCNGNVNNLSAVLQDFLPLSDDDILDCLLCMANHVQTIEDRTLRNTNELFYQIQRNDTETTFTIDRSERKVAISWNVDIFIQFCMDQHPNLKVPILIKI
jgi:hypothetical protein